MRYSIDDKVKVVKHSTHYFPLGTEGVIVDVYEENQRYEVKGFDIIMNRYYPQIVSEEDIILIEEPKMPKYTTEPIDYTGCHPVIAEHLKRGEAILCRVREYDHSTPEVSYVHAYIKKFPWGYNTISLDGYYTTCKYAEPISVKRRVLMSAEKAVVKLIENGWKLSPDCTEIQKPGTGLILECLKEREGMERSMLEFYPDYLFEEVDD